MSFHITHVHVDVFLHIQSNDKTTIVLQAGFAMLEVGTVRAKNTKNILIKNVMDACLGVLIWWAFGFAFAFGVEGANPNAFIGGKQFFMLNYAPTEVNAIPYASSPTPNSFAFWFFQWTFAATAATIVSGAVAERCRFTGYLTYTFFLTGFIYPVVVHWVWSSQGWLSAFFSEEAAPGQTNLYKGMIDFAGSGVVHTTGGVAAFWGAFFLGPRIGRFDADGNVMELPGHSASLAALGVLILWFGFYGFNPGSTLGIWFSGESGQNFAVVAGKVACTTSISAGAGGMSTLKQACNPKPEIRFGASDVISQTDSDAAFQVRPMASSRAGVCHTAWEEKTMTCSMLQSW